MSPESVTEGKLVAAHDIWAVGCIVSQMLTNKLLWGKRSLGSDQIRRNLIRNIKPSKILLYQAQWSTVVSECLFC